ncbi:MAG: hypothetical protein IPM31_17885 [Anaerolineae bacterium]|nr:hypothetical protein [Anaerolineae bacterium]
MLGWRVNWKKRNSPPLRPEGFGQLLVQQNGCTACHSLTGERWLGPTWFGLYGSQVETLKRAPP